MAHPSEKNVLVVDDEPDVRNFLAAVIEDAGFTVDTAVNGVEALEKVGEKAPDLITLDLVMPRKSGVRFMRQLRENEAWAKIPVIVITAHARDEFGSDEIKELNAFTTRLKPKYVFEKPVRPEGLVKAITEILGVEAVEKETATEETELKKVLSMLVEKADADTLKSIREMLMKK